MTQQQDKFMQSIIEELEDKSEENNCLIGFDLLIINSYKSGFNIIKQGYTNYIMGIHRKNIGGEKSNVERIEKP